MSKWLRGGVSATALALVLCGAARADDFSSAAYRWDGFFIGGHLGYAEADDYWFDSENGNARNDGNLMGGLQAGYNWQSGDIFWGLVADASAVGLEGGDVDYIQAEVNFLGSVRARLGLSFQDILIYGTGGIGLVTGDAASSTNPNDRDGFEEAVYVVGGGAEFALDNRLSVGGEVLYFGETGEFEGHEDNGKVEGIWAGRVFLNVAMTPKGTNIEPVADLMVEESRWEGLYVGGHFGYGEVQDFWFNSSGATGGPQNLGNFVGGLQIGTTGSQVISSGVAKLMPAPRAWKSGNGITRLPKWTGWDPCGRDWASIWDRFWFFGTGGIGFVVGAGSSSTVPTEKDDFFKATYVVGGGCGTCCR